MMDEAATEQLSAYLDGELTEAEVAELEHRLARDPALRGELDALRAAVDLLRTHGPVQAPKTLLGDILRAVEDEPVPGGFWRWLQRPFGLPLTGVAITAVALLVLVVAVGSATLPGLQAGMSGSRSDATMGDYELAKEPAVEAAAQEKEVAPLPAPKPTRAQDTEATTRRAPEPDVVAVPEITTTTADGKSRVGTPDLSGSMQNAAPMQGTADDQAGDGISTGQKLYSGVPMPMIALAPEDLETVARLMQRYGAKDVAGGDPAAKVADLADGRHQVSLRLPDGAARNAFVTELKKAFPQFNDSMRTDDTITLDQAQVDLVISVSHTLRGGTDAYKSMKAAPASTEQK